MVYVKEYNVSLKKGKYTYSQHAAQLNQIYILGKQMDVIDCHLNVLLVKGFNDGMPFSISHMIPFGDSPGGIGTTPAQHGQG